MDTVNEVSLFLHFVGLALGFAAAFGNMTVGILIAKAAPAERVVLGRVPPALGVLGRSGIVTLWVTGVFLTYSKWDGGSVLPWQFQAKLVDQGYLSCWK